MLSQHYYLYGDMHPDEGVFSICESREENYEDIKKYAEDHPDKGIIFYFDNPRPSPKNLRPEYVAEIRTWEGEHGLMWFSVFRYPPEKNKESV